MLRSYDVALATLAEAVGSNPITATNVVMIAGKRFLPAAP